MKRILLDTNAYTALLTGDQKVLHQLETSNQIFMSTIVLGELHAGFSLGTKRHQNQATLNKFLAKPTVTILDITHASAKAFGQLKANLQRQGAPIPINDVWIAAHAFEAKATLITYDHHFKQIKSIQVWKHLA